MICPQYRGPIYSGLNKITKQKEWKWNSVSERLPEVNREHKHYFYFDRIDKPTRSYTYNLYKNQALKTQRSNSQGSGEASRWIGKWGGGRCGKDSRKGQLKEWRKCNIRTKRGCERIFAEERFSFRSVNYFGCITENCASMLPAACQDELTDKGSRNASQGFTPDKQSSGLWQTSAWLIFFISSTKCIISSNIQPLISISTEKKWCKLVYV